MKQSWTAGFVPKLEPAVYTHEWRMQVEKLLADYRASKK